MQVAIVDYGAGNLQSVANMVYAMGGDPEIAGTAERIASADRLILPGVGASGSAIARLRQNGMDEALTERVRLQGYPMLGICLGLQLLAERLSEFGDARGLGWIGGDIVKLDTLTDGAVPTPHMGWNQAGAGPGAGAFENVLEGQEFYFAHSYTLRTENSAIVAATTGYGATLVTAVHFDTVFATQFHPEKSQIAGERLIERFLAWRP